MIEIRELHVYPLTSARAQSLDAVALNAAGMVTDRMLVLYDASLAPEEKNRIGQKRYRNLARVDANYDKELDATHIGFPDGAELTVPILEGEPDCWVNEFGDITPCIDLGDEPAELFSNFLNRPHVRLAQKTPDWMEGSAVGPMPADRRVAPLHIVAEESVEALQEQAERNGFGAERFRPNIVVRGHSQELSPLEEISWVGRVLTLGGVRLVLHRATARCPIPGYDQTTGENKKDVPELYSDLPKNEGGNPLFGVYAYPVIGDGVLHMLQVGDRGSF